MKPKSTRYNRRAIAIAKSWGVPCTKHNVGMLYHTRTPCSCAMCGNPRHFDKGKEKLTMQERRSLDAYHEQLSGV